MFQKKDTQIDSLCENNITYNKADKMASIMNKFFSNIGTSIDETIPLSDEPFAHYMGEVNRYDITLNPCSETEIKSYIDNLNISKATGPFRSPPQYYQKL